VACGGPGRTCRVAGPPGARGGGPDKVLGVGIRVVGQVAAAWKGFSRFEAGLDKHLLMSEYSG
jgi:hypothetical protein